MLCALAVLVAAPARAVEIAYTAVDLADAQPGVDRWLYRYQLDEFLYGAGYGFTVYFDPDLYAELDAGALAPDQWDPVVADPDVNLGAYGYYDVEARVSAPSVATAFTVSFRWLGAGTPGPQPFEVREPDPSFDVVESGTTVVPEPAAFSLGACALAALVRTRRSPS